jgi:hypothetical protein
MAGMQRDCTPLKSAADKKPPPPKRNGGKIKILQKINIQPT